MRVWVAGCTVMFLMAVTVVLIGKRHLGPLGGLAVGVLMVILLFEKPLYTWPGLLIVATGVPVYLIWRGRQTA